MHNFKVRPWKIAAFTILPVLLAFLGSAALAGGIGSIRREVARGAPAPGAIGSGVVQFDTATIGEGTGDPEGAVTATVGSLWLRTDGGAGTTLYTKETGSGNTGWATVGGAALTGVTEDGGTPNVVTVTDVLRVGTTTAADAAGEFAFGTSGNSVSWDIATREFRMRSSNSQVILLSAEAANPRLAFVDGGYLAWSLAGSEAGTNQAASLSALGASELAVGNGTEGNATGTLTAATVKLGSGGPTLTASGATTVFSGATTHSANVRVTDWQTTLTDATATAILQVTVASGTSVGGVIDVAVHATDGTDYQARTFNVWYAAHNKAGTVAITVLDNEDTLPTLSASTGTLDVTTVDATTGAGVATIRLTVTSSLTTTSFVANCHVRSLSGQAVTPQ